MDRQTHTVQIIGENKILIGSNCPRLPFRFGVNCSFRHSTTASSHRTDGSIANESEFYVLWALVQMTQRICLLRCRRRSRTYASKYDSNSVGLNMRSECNAILSSHANVKFFKQNYSDYVARKHTHKQQTRKNRHIIHVIRKIIFFI